MAVPHPSIPLIESRQILGTPDPAEARRIGRLVLAQARQCPVCQVLTRHLSTLGHELRPCELIERVAPWERDEHSVRLAAAWIVLHAW